MHPGTKRFSGELTKGRKVRLPDIKCEMKNCEWVICKTGCEARCDTYRTGKNPYLVYIDLILNKK